MIARLRIHLSPPIPNTKVFGIFVISITPASMAGRGDFFAYPLSAALLLHAGKLLADEEDGEEETDKVRCGGSPEDPVQPEPERKQDRKRNKRDHVPDELEQSRPDSATGDCRKMAADFCTSVNKISSR